MSDAFGDFVWDPEKEVENVQKHGVDFVTGAKVFNPDFAIEPIIRETNWDFSVQAKSGLTLPPTSRACVGLENCDEAATLRADFSNEKSGFKDPNRKIFTDSKHSHKESRMFCLGKVDDKVLTVRFTYRNNKIRIFGAGYWRKGVRYYEKEN